jgi:hypothetical protein
MKTIKNVGLALLVVQCSFNILTVAIFLFAPSILRQGDGGFSTLARMLVWGGGLLSIPAVGIFSYATQKEQTYQKASADAPEGGKVAQRDLSLAIVGFVSEMLTLYWILR